MNPKKITCVFCGKKIDPNKSTYHKCTPDNKYEHRLDKALNKYIKK